MKKLLGILSVALFTIAGFQIQAQSASLDEIIENYLENIGGVDAWKKVESMKMTGSVVTQMGAMDMKMLSMKPNLLKVSVEVEGMGTIIPQAFDGETAWMLMPFSGDTDPKKMPEEVTEEMKKQPFQDEFIDYKEKGSTVELSAETKEIDGTETYEVKLVNKDGIEKYYYFDTENFVPIMQKQTMTSGQMKGMTMETYMSDYQEVDGLMIPHSMEQKASGQSVSEITMTKIEVNPEGLTKADFAMPTTADDKQ